MDVLSEAASSWIICIEIFTLSECLCTMLEVLSVALGCDFSGMRSFRNLTLQGLITWLWNMSDDMSRFVFCFASCCEVFAVDSRENKQCSLREQCAVLKCIVGILLCPLTRGMALKFEIKLAFLNHKNKKTDAHISNFYDFKENPLEAQFFFSPAYTVLANCTWFFVSPKRFCLQCPFPFYSRWFAQRLFIFCIITLHL